MEMVCLLSTIPLLYFWVEATSVILFPQGYGIFSGDVHIMKSKDHFFDPNLFWPAPSYMTLLPSPPFLKYFVIWFSGFNSLQISHFLLSIHSF